MKLFDLSYEPGSGGPAIDLVSSGIKAGTADQLRGHAWDYELGRRDITAPDRPARECECDVVFMEPGQADELRRTAARDVEAGTPGSLVSDGWRQRCYITAEEPSGIVLGFHKSSLTVVLLDGTWRKLSAMQDFNPAVAGGGDYLDLPHDVPYDLQPVSVRTSIEGPAHGSGPIRMIVYGYVENPAVTIGGNTYQVMCAVPAGGYLVIDGAEARSDRMIYTVSSDGTVTNRFADGVRGGGRGSGSYIFERIEPGLNAVSWDYSFGFALGYYDEEASLPWTRTSS